jgi:hypothetical protein
MFLVRVEISDLPLHFPWESENWLMGAFEHADFDEKSLVRLKRVQYHQQAVFISDVLNASGKATDRRYMTRRQRGETWSTLIFLQEQPMAQDFKLWENAFLCIAPR